MNCRDVRPLLARYVEGEADSDEQILIKQHLAECQDCSAEVSQLRVTQRRVQREIKSWAASAVPPASAWDRLLAKLAAEKEAAAPITQPTHLLMNNFRRGTNLVIRFAWMGLLMVVIAAALFLTFRNPPTTRNTNELKDTMIADDPNRDHMNLLPEVITRRELVKRFKSPYMLKVLPYGFTLKITATPKLTASHDVFLIDYHNAAHEYFLIQSVNEPAGFGDMKVETYSIASGLTIHIMDERASDDSTHLTSAVVDLPDGGHILLASNLPRDQVKSWIENLVPATS